MKNEPPLCVDMDDTLIRGDCLFSAMAWLLRRKPFSFFFSLCAYAKSGRAAYKRYLAENTNFDPTTLPVFDDVLQWCVTQKKNGRALWLVSGSDEIWAKKVAEKLGIFEKVVASDGHHNVSGKGKRELLNNLCGEHSFDYVGNAAVDFPVWESARFAVLANCPKSLAAKARKKFQVIAEIGQEPKTINALLRAARPVQWLKNLLIFAPIITSHHWANIEMWKSALGGFFTFCLAASGVYFVNDFLDKESDAMVHIKKQRPVASGELGELTALFAGIVLLILAVLGAFFFSLKAVLAVLFYIVVAIFYSVFFKKVMVLDVLILTLFYLIRIFSGGIYAGIDISPWLTSFAAGVFLFLASLKRIMFAGETWRGFTKTLPKRLAVIGMLIATTILLGYRYSDQAAELYSKLDLLVMMPVIVLIWFVWIFRRCMQLSEAKVAVDPFTVVIRDAWSWLALSVFILIVLFAK